MEHKTTIFLGRSGTDTEPIEIPVELALYYPSPPLSWDNFNPRQGMPDPEGWCVLPPADDESGPYRVLGDPETIPWDGFWDAPPPEFVIVDSA